MKVTLSLLIFLLLVTKSYQQHPWDGFGLALIWPPGYCHSLGASGCIVSKVKSDFTIHGLWPFVNSGAKLSSPSNPISAYTKITTNSPLFNPLIAYWPNIEVQKSDDGFWSHEWNDHGRVSFSLFDQNQYFTKALDLFHMNNITHLLKNAGIIPGGQYGDTQFLNTIHQALHVDVRIQCKGTYLIEVRICFNPAATAMINCNTNGITGRCPTSFTYKS